MGYFRAPRLTVQLVRQFLPRDPMHSADYAIAKCPSVCPSITRRYNSSFFALNDMAVFGGNPPPLPNGGVECNGYEKVAIFYQYITLFRERYDRASVAMEWE